MNALRLGTLGPPRKGSAKGRLGVPGGNQKETGTTGPISSLLWHVCCAQLHSAAQHFWQNCYMDIGIIGLWENGDRLGTSLGKARPSPDVQLLSKTGEAGK